MISSKNGGCGTSQGPTIIFSEKKSVDLNPVTLSRKWIGWNGSFNFIKELLRQKSHKKKQKKNCRLPLQPLPPHKPMTCGWKGDETWYLSKLVNLSKLFASDKYQVWRWIGQEHKIMSFSSTNDKWQQITNIARGTTDPGYWLHILNKS